MMLFNNKKILIDRRTFFTMIWLKRASLRCTMLLLPVAVFLHLNSSNNIMELSAIFLIIFK